MDSGRNSSQVTEEAKWLVLFDGICHFCNNSVNFIMDRDPDKNFLFAPLQSDYAQDKLNTAGEPIQEMDTIIVLHGLKIYKRSRAALEITRRLSGLWPLCYAAIIIPAFIRDAAYNLLARNRYKWFGKMDACRIPTPDQKERFRG